MYCANQVNLQIYKNKTKTYELQFTKDGAGIDITDYTIYFIVKTKKSDSDASAVLLKTVTDHTDPINGLTEIKLSKDDTDSLDIANYWYSVEFNDGDSGSDEDEDVLYEGKLAVLRPTRIGS